MGEVWLAEDTRLGRRVALKSLKGDWLNTPNARQTVMGEGRRRPGSFIRTSRRSSTFSTPTVSCSWSWSTSRAGRSARLSPRAISPSYAMRIIAEIAGAVGYAHDRGIIHCDLKPGNIQIGFDGSAKILDFGLARAAFDASDPNRSITKRMFAGTPAYLAPERVMRGSISAAGDIYSLGVMLYELTSGRRPFDEPEVTGLFLAILFADPPPPSQLVDGLPLASTASWRARWREIPGSATRPRGSSVVTFGACWNCWTQRNASNWRSRRRPTSDRPNQMP